jgi:hypothetical protein
MALRAFLALWGPLACLCEDVISVTPPPAFFDELLAFGFDQYSTVFGVPLLAHHDVPTGMLRHAAHVRAAHRPRPEGPGPRTVRPACVRECLQCLTAARCACENRPSRPCQLHYTPEAICSVRALPFNPLPGMLRHAAHVRSAHQGPGLGDR